MILGVIGLIYFKYKDQSFFNFWYQHVKKVPSNVKLILSTFLISEDFINLIDRYDEKPLLKVLLSEMD